MSQAENNLRKSPATTQILQLAELCREYLPQRDHRLFTDFLPAGYQLMTLSCVPQAVRERLLVAKCCLGILITLLDDFADRPDMHNPDLLNRLYQQGFMMGEVSVGAPDGQFVPAESGEKIPAFAQHIFSLLKNTLAGAVHYQKMLGVLEFDLQQIYHCIRYFQLATTCHFVLNRHEVTYLGPFNMGMVLAGDMDLVFSPACRFSEMGMIREFFHLAQRFGKMCNNEATLARELREKDYKNELLWGDFSGITPAQEMSAILQRLVVLGRDIQTFAAQEYVAGLQKFRELHQNASSYI